VSDDVVPPLRGPSPSTLALLMAEEVTKPPLPTPALGPNGLLALVFRTALSRQAAAMRLAEACRCDHARGAHEGKDHDGPCSTKLCRKARRCAKYRGRT
jgi:hypothetical protein